MDIFRRTNIDYGRIDYSLAGKTPQVWEINTHPTVLKLTPRLTEGFEAIDTPATNDHPKPVSFRAETLAQVNQEARSRSRSKSLRTAVSALASTPAFERVKQMLKKWFS